MRKRWIPVIVGGVVLVLAVAFLVGRGFRSDTEDQQVGVEKRVAYKAALVNYRNLLDGCIGRGNELRENTLTLALILSEAERPELASPAKGVVYRMRHADYSRHDGTIECVKAVDKP